MLPASDSTLIKTDGKFNPTIHVNNNKKKKYSNPNCCTKLSALEWIVVQMKGKVSTTIKIQFECQIFLYM